MCHRLDGMSSEFNNKKHVHICFDFAFRKNHSFGNACYAFETATGIFFS